MTYSKIKVAYYSFRSFFIINLYSFFDFFINYEKTASQIFFFQAEDGIRDVERSRGLGDVYKRQIWSLPNDGMIPNFPLRWLATV